MLQQEKGPWEIFSRFQAWFWSNPYRAGGLKDGLRCFNCTSVWISFLPAMGISNGNLGLFLLYWFSIAAGAMIINRVYEQWLDK